MALLSKKGGVFPGAVYIPVPGVEKIIANSPEAMILVKSTADDLAEQARNNTPHKTGETASDIGSVGPVLSADGATAYVTTDSPIWHIIEYGSVHNPPFAPFRRAVEQTGLQWTDPGDGENL